MDAHALKVIADLVKAVPPVVDVGSPHDPCLSAKDKECAQRYIDAMVAARILLCEQGEDMDGS